MKHRYLKTSATMNHARMATATLAASTTKNRPHLGELPWRNSGGSPFRSFIPNIAVSCFEGKPPISQVAWRLT
jgi:hypothetical protein